MPKDVRLHSKGDSFRSQYELHDFTRGGLSDLLGILVLLLVVSLFTLVNSKLAILDKLKCQE